MGAESGQDIDGSARVTAVPHNGGHVCQPHLLITRHDGAPGHPSHLFPHLLHIGWARQTLLNMALPK